MMLLDRQGTGMVMPRCLLSQIATSQPRSVDVIAHDPPSTSVGSAGIEGRVSWASLAAASTRDLLKVIETGLRVHAAAEVSSPALGGQRSRTGCPVWCPQDGAEAWRGIGAALHVVI